MDNRPLVSVREAARSLGVGPATVYRLCRAGSIPSVRVGKAVRVHPSTVDAIRQGGLPQEGGNHAC
jgi:excisionase family DNA binding protein